MSAQLQLLATYPYTYGAGNAYNREIAFFRKPGEPEKIYAQINASHLNQQIILGKVEGQKINVEMLSTTQKMDAMIEARRQGSFVQSNPVLHLSQLSEEQQDKILGELNRNHGRRIEILNDVGGPSGLEKVIQLSIFDPR